MKKILLKTMVIGLSLLVSLPAIAQPPPTYVFLKFEGDPGFPSVTSLRDTSGLAPFTGSAFRLTPSERDQVVQWIVYLVREDFKDFNIKFLTSWPAAGLDYYTWGIDDTSYVYADLLKDDDGYEYLGTVRVYGKAGGNPNTDPGDHPRHARTWAGSFALVPGIELPPAWIQVYEERIPFTDLVYCEFFCPTHPMPLEVSILPYEIPFEPLCLYGPAALPIMGFCPPFVDMPVTWNPSNPPLIQSHHCTLDESNCDTGWGCGRYNCRPSISLGDIARALANNAAHEISHLFGTLHHEEINPATGEPVDAMTDKCTADLCIGYLLVSQDEAVEGLKDKSFGADNYQILMDALGPAPPESPELTSPTHSKGQPSCEQVLTVEWATPWAVLGVGGYSYTIVSQDDPLYDIHRTPDDTIDLDASATSFTTPPLEPGHIWEFNIRTIDTTGTPSKIYSSFWVEIESCSVEITRPRSGDIFEVGEWVNIYWNQVTYGGDDVGGAYDVSLALMKGPDVVVNIGSNLPNILGYGFTVPDVDPGSDYNLRIILGRNSIGDMFPYLPERLIGFSDYFSIVNTPAGSPVEVTVGDATITFEEVTDAGDTTVTESDSGPAVPPNFEVSCTPPVYYDITTTATYSGTIEICLSYDDAVCDENDLHLFHYEGDTWVDVTTSVDTAANIICGEVTSLSEFLLATPIVVEPAPVVVDDLVSVSIGRVGYDRRTGQFSVSVTVTNTSATAIGSPVWLVIESISSPSVTVANADGTTADGKEYLDLSGLLGDGQLDPGETVTTRLYFNNPSRVRFKFVPSVRGVILP